MGTEHTETPSLRKATPPPTSPLRPDDPRVIQIAAAIVGLFQPPAAPPPADELIALAKTGMDRGALDRLSKRGLLPTVRIGRSKYCKRSDLVALVDKLGAQRVDDTPPPADDYEAAVARVAKRGRR